MTRIQLTDDEQVDAFEDAKALVEDDVDDEFVDAERATRGRNAGEVPYGEVVRVLAEAYTGTLGGDDD